MALSRDAAGTLHCTHLTPSEPADANSLAAIKMSMNHPLYRVTGLSSTKATNSTGRRDFKAGPGLVLHSNAVT